MNADLPQLPKRSFLNLTEFLVLIVVVGILGVLLGGPVKNDLAGNGWMRTVSDLRQIGQASLIYAHDNGGMLPPRIGLNADGIYSPDRAESTPHLHAIAAALARSGGLNDGMIWLSPYESRNHGITTILKGESPRLLKRDFAETDLVFQYIAGLRDDHPNATPIAFFRGLKTDGRWDRDPAVNRWGERGAIVRLDGSVATFEAEPRFIFWRRPIQPAEFTDSAGRATHNVLEAIGPGQAIYSTQSTETGSPNGKPGTGPRL